MKSATNTKKFVRREPPRMVLATMTIAFVVVMITVSQIPRASAEQMEIINASREIPASVDKVWNIISNVDKDPLYWSGIKEVKNVNTNSNVVERDITTINNAEAHQIVTLDPKKSIIINQTAGPIIGTRTLILSPSDVNGTKIDVSWNMDLSGIPIIGRGFAKDNILKFTEEALNKIADAAK
jgi:Polyketide cyclase / dehydrase and lipid transport